MPREYQTSLDMYFTANVFFSQNNNITTFPRIVVNSLFWRPRHLSMLKNPPVLWYNNLCCVILEFRGIFLQRQVPVFLNVVDIHMKLVTTRLVPFLHRRKSTESPEFCRLWTQQAYPEQRDIDLIPLIY